MINIDENQFKSRECPTPELDKTNKERYKSMTTNINIGNVQFQSQTKPLTNDTNRYKSIQIQEMSNSGVRHNQQKTITIDDN